MKKRFYIFTLTLLCASPVLGNMVVNTELPREYGTFGVNVTGEEIKEVIVFIPQCIGGIGIKDPDGNFMDGNKYTIKTDENCRIEAPFETLK